MFKMILKERKLLERIMKTNCKKKNQKQFRVEKVIKRKCGELYVKWKGSNTFLMVELIKRYSINE